MLFAALVLVAVDGEHDCLKQRIDFGHGHQPAEVRNVTGLGLKEEEEVAVDLSLFVVRKEPLLGVSRLG